MGYHTQHSLNVDDAHALYLDEHMQKIATQVGIPDLWEEECKWYECVGDMTAYSNLWPDTTFIVDGVGESSDDIWRNWFKNGQVRNWKLEINIPDDPLEPFK